MKTIHTFLIAATLIATTAVLPVSAQRTDVPAYPWKVAVGDSVKIHRDCTKYLTGETPSAWVYDKVHTVGQLGTRRFPEGILLMNISSWVCEECITPVHPMPAAVVEQTPAEAEVIEAPAPTATVEQAPVENEPMEEVPVEQAPVAEAPVEETPVEETPVVESPVEEAPVAEAPVEETPAPAPAQIYVEQIKGDSIKSKQNFRHGYDRFTIGLRGGASSLLHNLVAGKWQCGGDVLLDLQYAHYWAKDGRPVDLGIVTGVALGYAQSAMKASVDSRYHVNNGDPDLPNGIDYTITSDAVKEHDGQLQLEIPLFFSLVHHSGLFFNFGPKFMMPLYTPYKQTIDKKNTLIVANIVDIDVPMTNEAVTGQLQKDDYSHKGSDYKNNFTIHVMLGAELGYEWILKSGNSLGLGAYANYSVYNSFKNSNTSTKPLIEVTPLVGDNAVVTVNPATKTYAKGLGFFDVGVKVAYHFNFPKKKQINNAKLF